MTVSNQNIDMFVGETKVVSIAVTGQNGGPQTLTGATTAWYLRSQQGATALLSKTPTLTNTNDTDDTLTFTLAPVDTASLAPGSYWHECEVTDSSSVNSVVCTGLLTLKAR